MKFSWAYLLQFTAASILFGAATAAPTTDPEPAVVERAIEARHGDHYFWFIDDAERAHLSDLLDVDFNSLRVKGVILSGPKQKCQGCGKLSGLDDIVHNTLEEGIHSKEFMVKVFETGGPHASSEREIRCSSAGCGRAHLEKRYWLGDWIRVGDAEEEKEA